MHREGLDSWIWTSGGPLRGPLGKHRTSHPGRLTDLIMEDEKSHWQIKIDCQRLSVRGPRRLPHKDRRNNGTAAVWRFTFRTGPAGRPSVPGRGGNPHLCPNRVWSSSSCCRLGRKRWTAGGCPSLPGSFRER